MIYVFSPSDKEMQDKLREKAITNVISEKKY